MIDLILFRGKEYSNDMRLPWKQYVMSFAGGAHMTDIC